MAYRLLAYMDGVEYNRKLFQIDGGEEDLPPIKNKTEIQPGSEAHSLRVTTGRWKLDTDYKWVFVPYPGGYCDPASGAIADVPRNPINTCYIRVVDEMGVRSWEPLQIGTLQEVNVSMAIIGTHFEGEDRQDMFIDAKGGVYDMIRARVVFLENGKVIEVSAFDRNGKMYQCPVPAHADWFYITIKNVPKLGDTNPDFSDAILCAAVDRGNRIPTMTNEEWLKAAKKPLQAFISDSIFDMNTVLKNN